MTGAAAERIPPERVARAVHHALTSPHPRGRYLVSVDAVAQAAVARVLPKGLFDRLALRAIGVAEEPGRHA